MAASRVALQRVSGHMAWAGSDGPAKNSRNAETSVARMTLRARANRLRMYVSTFCLPNGVGAGGGGPEIPDPHHGCQIRSCSPEGEPSLPTQESSHTSVRSGMPLFGLLWMFLTFVPKTELPLSLLSGM